MDPLLDVHLLGPLIIEVLFNLSTFLLDATLILRVQDVVVVFDFADGQPMPGADPEYFMQQLGRSLRIYVH